MSKASKRERQRLNREQRRQYEQTLARRRKTMKTVRTFALFAVPVIALGVVLSVTGGSGGTSVAEAAGCRDVKKVPKAKDKTFASAPPMTIDTTKTYVAHVQTSCGSFAIQLAAAQAPQTVNSFVFLAKQHFYDGLKVFRVAKDFAIQTGDPKNNGKGGPGYTLPEEPPADGYQEGSVAMSKEQTPHSTGSQFFIIPSEKHVAELGGPPYLYSALGQVTDGFETVRRINKLGSTSQVMPKQKPKATVLLDKVTIEEVAPSATATTGVSPPSS